MLEGRDCQAGGMFDSMSVTPGSSANGPPCALRVPAKMPSASVSSRSDTGAHNISSRHNLILLETLLQLLMRIKKADSVDKWHAACVVVNDADAQTAL